MADIVKCPVCRYFHDHVGEVWITESVTLCVKENSRGRSVKLFLWAEAWRSDWYGASCEGQPIAFIPCPLCAGEGEVDPALAAAYWLVFGGSNMPIYQNVERMRSNLGGDNEIMR